MLSQTRRNQCMAQKEENSSKELILSFKIIYANQLTSVTLAGIAFLAIFFF